MVQYPKLFSLWAIMTLRTVKTSSGYHVRTSVSANFFGSH